MANESLFDALAGAAGHPVNRPAMNAYITQGQALAGLHSAQTEDALLNAQRMREEQDAGDELENAFVQAGHKPADAHLMATASKLHAGSATNALEMQKASNVATLSDPSQLNSPAQTAAQQGIQGKVAEPVTAPDQFVTLPGMTPPHVQSTPLGAAKTHAETELGHLRGVQADVGGFNPHTGAIASLPDAEKDAITKAVNDGRLDPMRVNSRNAGIYAGIEMRNPGATNFNRLHADAALQANPTFQQKAIAYEALPTVMSHMTSLGKKIGYSDYKVVGRMEQWFKGETNDPDLSEYMTVRNDVLMNIASVMRGVGMSDQAHNAEIEAAAPTKSPLALDGWLKGQMAALEPRLKEVERVKHLGDKTPTTPAADTPPAAATGGPVEGQTAFNKATNQRLVFRGGTWQPQQ